MAKPSNQSAGSPRRRAKAPAAAKLSQLAAAQVDDVLAAFARVLRPLVRLALHVGAKHAQLDSLLRNLLIEEARRTWLEQGVEANISQLSVTTGLNRKAVTLIVRDAVEHLPQSEMSAPSKTLTLWLRICTDQPSLRKLPIAGAGGEPSFESVAHEATRGNVHHRALLDELERLGMVKEHEGTVELNADGFVPARDQRGMLAFLGDNARDHLAAAVSNTIGGQPAFLERSVFARGISVGDCERILQLTRARWNVLHHELAHELTDAFTSAPESARARMRVGIYAYFEDIGSGVSTPDAVSHEPRLPSKEPPP